MTKSSFLSFPVIHLFQQSVIRNPQSVILPFTITYLPGARDGVPLLNDCGIIFRMKHPPLSFPKDHGSHNTIVEWWYFNGHLMDAKKRRYAFMDCFFKVNVQKANIPFLKHLPVSKKHEYVHFGHSILTDIKKKTNVRDIHLMSRISHDSFTRPELFINYTNPLSLGRTNYEIAQTGPSTIHIKTEAMDLSLEIRKVPMLEQGKGYIAVCGRESAYYSLTHLVATGKILVEKKWIEVDGVAWMDHQWANEGYNKDQWSWFCMQLENGTELMCVEYDRGQESASFFDLIKKDGRSEHGTDIFFARGTDTWKSPKTKSAYPLTWAIEIPSQHIHLTVTAPVPDQEMVAVEVNYWEGPLDVQGTIAGKPVRGVGFMELVRHDAGSNLLSMAGREMIKKFSALKKLL